MAGIFESTHVMIDLETLATTPQAIVLSIGAQVFDIDGILAEPQKQFYCVLPYREQVRMDRYKDPATMGWWDRQSAEARQILTDSSSCLGDLYTGMQEFKDWFARNTQGAAYAWGLGALMDLAILEDLFRQLRLPVPWDYRHAMCFRTLRELYNRQVPAPAFVGTRHNALADAQHQALHAVQILRHIRRSNNDCQKDTFPG